MSKLKMTEKPTYLDLRGLVCPQPVLRVKKLFDDPKISSAKALVEDQINVNNLARLARSLNLSMASNSTKDGYLVELTRNHSLKLSQNKSSAKNKSCSPKAKQTRKSQSESEVQKVGTVIFINRDSFGQGDPEFSTHLLNLFLQTVYETGHVPRAILLANSGVKIIAKDSAFHKVLNDFRKLGCEVLACGLCLQFYKLQDNVSADHVTNMFAICEYLFAADKIIQP